MNPLNDTGGRAEPLEPLATILEGGLPESQRTAIVVPRLKGSGLDPADVKSHRPISNLSFMSKVIERVIFRQLVVYLDSNNLVPKYQSGFRKHHSTESATLRVLSDIYSAIDNGRIALLALLDVSAAFDTVDHDILMHRLSESFGIVGQAHDWLSSFVTCRTYSVRFGGSTTSPWKVRLVFRRDRSSDRCCTYCTQRMSQRSWNPWVSKCTYTPTILNSTISAAHRKLRRWRSESTPPSRQSAVGCRRTDCAWT